MPTQEQINAANVELQIANDNYTSLANQYNTYRNVLQAYANASPEKQAAASGYMRDVMDNFQAIKLAMYWAEDRVQQAQNAVNSLNEVTVAQPTQTSTVRRRQYPNNYEEVLPATTTVPENLKNSRTYQYFQNLNNKNSSYIPTSNYQPNQSMINNNLGLSWSITATPEVPYEIQNVRKLRWDSYLQWLNELQNKYWYNVIWQRAYRNNNSYRTY